MKQKVIPTKLDVFNIGDKLSFDVDTPRFLKEACGNSRGGIMVSAGTYLGVSLHKLQ